MSKNNTKSKADKEKAATKTDVAQKENDKSDLKKYIKDEGMIKILNKKGITQLFPIQYQTFDVITKGEDVVAKDRTGSGKTLAFALPSIIRMRQQQKFKSNHTPKLLIVLPTRELAIQVKEEISSLKYKDQQDFVVTAVYGGSGIQEQLDYVSKGVDIIVGTPGRLIDFLNRDAIKLKDLQTICLDEADQMLKIGFKDDIQRIFQCITKAKPTKIQCLLFSATIPEWIWQISDKYQSKSKKFIDMMKDNNVKTSKTVEHYCLKASQMQKQAYIGSIIKHFLKGRSGKIIIFCQTKKQVDRIGNSGLIPCVVETLHGDIKQFQRQKVFRKFKTGQAECLIATNVAARGLDFPEIDLIIQMQPPNTTDAYIHRSGRTGRAGKSGVCVTFYSYKEESLMKKIQSQTKINLHHINSKNLKPVATSSSNDSQHRQRQRQNSSYKKPSYDKNDKGTYLRDQSKSKFQKREQSTQERKQKSSDPVDY